MNHKNRIANDYRRGMTIAETARKWGVSQSSVWKIVNAHGYLRSAAETYRHPARGGHAANIKRNKQIMRLKKRGVSHRRIAKMLDVSIGIVAGVIFRAQTNEAKKAKHGAG